MSAMKRTNLWKMCVLPLSLVCMLVAFSVDVKAQSFTSEEATYTTATDAANLILTELDNVIIPTLENEDTNPLTPAQWSLNSVKNHLYTHVYEALTIGESVETAISIGYGVATEFADEKGWQTSLDPALQDLVALIEL